MNLEILSMVYAFVIVYLFVFGDISTTATSNRFSDDFIVTTMLYD